jgi:hypothetical protein
LESIRFAYDRTVSHANTLTSIALVVTVRFVLARGDDGSLGGVAMAENGLSERVERIDNKLDALSDSVDQRFREVDKQFLEVRVHFVEQRRCIKFAYDDELDKRMTAGSSRLHQRVDDPDKRMTEGRSRPASAARRPTRPSKRRR